ncbi:ketopantoate reductase family protein [Sneathiella sp. HT1-7]|uniref:ketopantoate reductase family protein n=1 Tax=Sneathiella sp. HT1-7 TaxID=2887192 RepID=UPI001D138AE9|nr:2-dehydropantoate 2-reductase [Sneathiella sp. HT1-7]MCC3305543.1 2-dehydropantoate 2-reductase [Sneathiella sp. HT1-7]
MKILIVGAGGVGGYFGAKLMQAGADITFLLRDKRHKLISENGLTIENDGGSFTIHPKSLTADQLTPDYDLIMLAPKSYDLRDSLNSLEKASGKGLFLPFLNGYNHLEFLDGRYGKDRVMGGVAHIAAMITETGAVKRLGDLGGLIVGHRTTAQEATAREFAALCEKADFNFTYSEDIEQSLWEKWVMLATLAAMTTLCLGSIGEIVATRYGAEMSRRTHAEACAIAAANSHPIPEKVQAGQLAMLTKEGSIFTASMMRDLVGGLRTEHEHILGDLIEKGAPENIDCPLLKIAYTHMAVVQGRGD